MNDNTAKNPPVLNFPLPVMAGGGNASLAARASKRAGHVELVITSKLLNGVVTVPAFEAFAFVEHLGELCIQAMPHDR